MSTPAVDIGWRHLAKCSEVSAAWFIFDDRENSRQRTRRENNAKAICQACPVRAQCLDYALATGEKEGIWGGLTPRERTEAIRATA